MKKIITMVLALCMLFSVITPSFAASDPVLLNKADFLNKSGLFKNLSSDFKDSTGRLQRGEAAVIFIRLTCKDAEILQNRSQYISDKVKDIKSTDVLAPYIGFITKTGVMKLDQEGNFNADDTISEKEFLMILAKALKYDEGISFKYIDTYKFTYNLGLVKEERYKTKSFNNYYYSRKDAISAIYNALQLKPNRSDNTLISDLIQNKIIARDYAVEAGLLTDTQVTQILDVKAISNTQVEISFNEPINEISDKNIKIYNQEDNGQIFISRASLSGKSLVLNTKGQIPDKKYAIELDNVVDRDGFNTQKLSSTFQGYKNMEILSDLFKISKIQVDGKNVINIFFTQPIDANSEIPSNFEIQNGSGTFIKGDFQTIVPRLVKKYNNCISLFLKEKDLKDGEQYTVKVGGDLRSVYGARLKDGSGDSIAFTANSANNKSFELISVAPIDNRTIVVEFNRDVDRSSGSVGQNYYVTSNGVPISVLRAALSSDGEGKKVILGLSGTLSSDKECELTINNVYDSYRQTAINSVKYSFYGTPVARDKIGIVSVQPTDKGTITVYFDRPIDSNSAMETNSYSISGSSSAVISKASFNYNDPYKVTLFLTSDSLVSGGSYTLTVYGKLRDESGNMFNSDATCTFSGTGEENLKPMLYDAKIIANDTIRVKVTEDIGTISQNTIASNYRLEYKDGSETKVMYASSVTLYDPNTLLIRFGSLDYSTQYALIFNSLTDFIGVNSRTSGDNMSRVGVSNPN